MRIKARRFDLWHLSRDNEVMMAPFDLSLAVLALLLTPGPTNSLVFLAAAERGFVGAARLIPAEVSGYLLTVVPLALAGAGLLADQPSLRSGVTLAAAIWVAVLAVRLWRLPLARTDAPGVTAGSLFLTTALNPKALIFGLALLPSPDRLAANLALFAGLVVLVALAWAGFGAAAGRGGLRQPRAIFVLRRLASVWLAVISVGLMLKGIGA
jgi:threonine/homoserine/homoserine lactone efflux protein